MAATRQLLRTVTQLSRALPAGNRNTELRWMMEQIVRDRKRAAAAARPTTTLPAPLPTLLSSLSTREQNRLSGMVADRSSGKPIQYVLGEWPFLDLGLTMREPVLIPRPETEFMVADIIAHRSRMDEQLLHHSRMPPLHIVDLCTGSGAIALALARGIPNAYVLGVDINPDAVALANHNKRRVFGTARSAADAANVHFAQCDIHDLSALTALVRARAKRYSRDGDGLSALPNMIVSNPPYVTLRAYRKLAESVRRWEDPRALIGDDSITAAARSGGHDAMRHYASIIDWAAQTLTPHPLTREWSSGMTTPPFPSLVLEGAGTRAHESARHKLLTAAGFGLGRVDDAGLPRAALPAGAFPHSVVRHDRDQYDRRRFSSVYIDLPLPL